MPISIRRAMPADATTLAILNITVHQLHVDAHPERFKKLMPDNPDLIAFFDKHLADEASTIFIAEDDTDAVGYLLGILRIAPENPFVYSLHDFHIDQMSIKETYQKQGIGQLLMTQAFETARALNADIISLGVAAFNQQAIGFYEGHGFVMRAHQMWQML
ncbi:MAG: GNAT family N-acetyltransferase [Aggregatilineales bacterium]